jgi:hypothetical protein
MTRLCNISISTLVLVTITGATPTDSSKQTVLIRSNDVTLRAEPDTTIGRHYTVVYTLPEDLTTDDLERAILEVSVDVSAKRRGDYFNPAPVFEVYALAEAYGESFDPEILHANGRVVRPVALGEGRRVVLEVTAIVRSHLDGSIENNGLIVGSLTGMREGDFVFVSGRFPEGAVGQLRIFRRHEFVPVEVPSEASRPARQ